MSPLLAQSGHAHHTQRCPLLGVKRTSGGDALMSAFDPKTLTPYLDQQRGSCEDITRLPSIWPAPRVVARSKTVSLALPPSLGAPKSHWQGSDMKGSPTSRCAPQP